MSVRRWSFAFALVLSACGSSSGPGPVPAPTDSSVLVGDVDGGKALIAVVRGSTSVTAYTCGVGPELATHTGWFFGALDGAGGALPAMTSRAGLELTGTVDGAGARGTLKLADGTTVPWSATPARPPAGLYELEDGVALAGLIVANDGRRAGNALVTTGGTPTSAPIATTTMPASTTTTGVVTTFPVATTTRTVTLQPVLSPDTKTVSQPSPTVLFLVHGMSDNIDTPGTGAQPDPVKCEGPRDTPFYSRCEWGIDFIPGLFGKDASAAMFNLAGRDLTGMKYLTDTVAQPPIDENLGITARDANGCVQDANAVEKYDPKALQHFVTAGAPVAATPPPLSVFVIWRDSTGGLVQSGLRVARQAYAALRAFETQYRKAAKVVFVGQSFGGLATRFVLSNPAPADVAASPAGVDRLVLCPEDRAKMDYLRDRTVLALTLATPHEGSFMAEFGEPIKTALRAELADLQRGVAAAATTEFGTAVRAVEQAVAAILGRAPGVFAGAQQELQRLQNVLNTPALRDLKLETMRAINLGPLSPDRARRTNGSPLVGAAGRLIPVYATLGRSPGSDAFDSPDILSGFARYDEQREKVKTWIVSTMWLSDLVVKQFFPDGFGRVDVAPYAPHAAILDRRVRLFDLSSQTKAAEDFLAQAANGVTGGLAAYFTGHFGAGGAGVAAFLRQARLQVSLPNAMIPIHLDRKWDLALTGTADVPMPALTCGGARVLIDYDPLVRALFAAFTTTEKLLAGVANQSLDQVVAAAGGVIADGAELATGTATWMTGKVAQLANVPAQCQLPTSPGDAVTSFYKLANLVSWRVVATTGPVPAPAWRRTDTPVTDGEMDTDGVVHAASALGLTLGHDPFFFEHDRSGSWYRLPDNPVTEKYNHGMQYHNDVGRWIAGALLIPTVGPVPRPDRFSVWP